MAQDRHVTVASGALHALSEPSFLIEHQGKLYMTLAVVEYDSKSPGQAPEQEKGVAEARRLFDAGVKASPARATIISANRDIAMLNTGPGPLPGPSKHRP